MVNPERKIILKLLLIITMVIQPVTFSYAMTSMDHNIHASSSEHSHYEDHAMNENMTDTHDKTTLEDSGELDNCCNTAACSPASMVSTITVSHVATSQYIVTITPAQKNIDLPIEIEPPRSLLD